MFADMRDTSTYSQFQYIVYHLDGRFTQADLTHTLNFLGKDATKPLSYKDFTDWYATRDQLKQDSQAGRSTKRAEKSSGSTISTAKDSKDKADEITDGKKSLKRTSSFRKTLSIVTGKDKDTSEEKKKEDKKEEEKKVDKKDKKKDKKDKHTSSSGSHVITNKPASDSTPRRGTEPPPMENTRSAAASLRGAIDKEAYKRAMLERYEAQQRENAEILKKKKEDVRDKERKRTREREREMEREREREREKRKRKKEKERERERERYIAEKRKEERDSYVFSRIG
jgi:hypothetical protein